MTTQFNARVIAEDMGLENVLFEYDSSLNVLWLLHSFVTFPHGVKGQPPINGRFRAFYITPFTTEAEYRELVRVELMKMEYGR